MIIIIIITIIVMIIIIIIIIIIGGAFSYYVLTKLQKFGLSTSFACDVKQFKRIS